MKFAYDVFNSPSHLPPIIFLHGLGDWRHTWKVVAPEVARKTKRQAYTPDARSHGSSPRIDGLDYDLLTQDVVDFMEDLAIESAVIVGHSMGGRTAINFALKHPDRTAAIVIEDMTPRNIDSGPQSFVSQLASIAVDIFKSIPNAVDVENAKRNLLDVALSFCGERFVDAERIKKTLDIGLLPIEKNGDTLGLAADSDALISMVKENALVQNLPDSGLQYTGDALFLYGSKAFFNLGKDTSVKKLFPNATVKKISGSSHYIHHDNPDVFIQVVSDFILGVDLPQSKY